MNIQERIDQTEEYETLVLDFNEYAGQITIDKPMIIDGQGSTIWSKTGPVIRIHSENVQLRNMSLEVTSAMTDEDASLALQVMDGVRVRMEDVVVKGNVSGIVNEDGSWEYPDALHLWPVIPGEKNYFVFDMDVPVSCVLETDISGLRIVNPGLGPGTNEIRVEVEHLKHGTILFGQIGIKSTYLTRIISVSGGSFGIPDTVRPDKDKPVRADSAFELPREPSPSSDAPGSPKPAARSGNFKLNPVIAIVIIIIAMAGGVLSLFFGGSEDGQTQGSDAAVISSEAEKDIHDPTGEMIGIRDSYTAGDTVSFTLRANDDNALRNMWLEIDNTSIRKSWQVGGAFAEQKVSFSTRDWSSGTYPCTFRIEDAAGNIREYKQRFDVNAIQYGYVNIFTRPSADIYIDGQSLGRTPKARLKVRAGRVDIRFVNESQNIDVIETVSVKPDETIRKRFEWK